MTSIMAHASCGPVTESVVILSLILAFSLGFIWVVVKYGE